MRLPFALFLACAIAGLSAAGAPVPKSPPAPKLTAEALVGFWRYEWDDWPAGVICFDKDGSYSSLFADHPPHRATVWAGTWALDGDVLTLTDSSFDAGTGEKKGGPVVYRFDFAGSKYPNLAGTANGAKPVKLSNPKR